MKVSSGSDNKVEINPYWSKIKIDELQKPGDPMEFSLSDTDSIPDLVSLSESEIWEESIVFILTPTNSSCTAGSEKGSPEGSIASFSDEEMTDLMIDEDEDGLTTFDAAMLNVEGCVEGV